MSEEASDKNKHGTEEPRPGSECMVVRAEISTVGFGDGVVFSEVVSVHLERCDACRAWAADLRRMHEACCQCAPGAECSHLTARALDRCAPGSVSRAPRRQGLLRRAEPVLDQGALFVVLLAAVLFNSILAFFLRGDGRVLYPVAGFVLMSAAALWVYRDAARRGMPAAFWAALQPFTLPAGLVAYLVCRERGSSRCGACGRLITGRDRFCPECGAKLTEFCCGCGRPVRKEFRVCPFCGTLLAECFPREDAGGAVCGWSRGQIAFVAIVNTALLAGLLAAVVRGEPGAAFTAAFLYLFGFFPVFNWVMIDSRRRAMPTVLWGVLVLATLYLGLVIYLACRTDTRVACPVCGSHPPASFNFCPCCGSMLGAGCPTCGAACESTDRFCPSCGVELVSEAASPPSRG